jgi:hypothetical protein
MSSTTFIDGTTPVIASWLNDVNTATYTTVPVLVNTANNNTVTKDSNTGAALLPVGTTAQRPSPYQGHFRYNTTISNWEGYNGSVWGPIASQYAGSITSSGLTQSTGKLLGRTTSATGSIEEITPDTTLALSSGSLGISSGGVGASKLSGNQTGAAPVFGIRAWATFNGATTGTNAPLSGGNVTSVTRNSTGVYTINFTTAMPDTLYAITAIGLGGNNGSIICITNTTGADGTNANLTTSVTVSIRTPAGTLFDSSLVSVCVLR